MPGPPTPDTPRYDPPTGETPGLGGSGGPRTTPVTFADWVFWYHQNDDEIENLKRRIYARRGSGSPLPQIGGGDLANRTDATRLTEKKVRESVVPALLWALDPASVEFDDTRAAAVISLAKVARSPAEVAAVRARLVPALKGQPLLEEAAATALGLLRRAAPEDQFPAPLLDEVRAQLFAAFENGALGVRTRALAMLSIGLLGDQPTGSAAWLESAGIPLPALADPAREAGERVTVQRILGLLAGKRTGSDEFPVALLQALALQPARAMSLKTLEALADCAVKGQWGGESASGLLRAHAALALGRLGGLRELRALRSLFELRGRGHDDARRSAAIALGSLGARAPGEDREAVARVLVRVVESSRDDSTRCFAIVSLARLLVADAREGRTALLAREGPAECLVAQAERSGYYQRPFAALGLGLVAAAVDDRVESEPWQDYRSRAVETLLAGMDDRALDKRNGRSAFCVALGIAGEERVSRRLVEILGDRTEEKEFRGYAALALGLLGHAQPEVTRTIAAAIRERSSEHLQMLATTALGLLGNPRIGGSDTDSMGLLIGELGTARSQAHKGQVVLALARIGDNRALDPLLGILRNPRERDLTRALACSGLGLIGDLEWLPSFSRLTQDQNYRATTDALAEIWTLL
jgi:hypothetical protein